MISQQLRQLRLARGLSLEELAQQMGHIVTKQALSKYEQGKANPTPIVLNKLAATLGVKVVDLLQAADFSVEFIAYRKRAALGKRDQEQIQCTVQEAIRQRVHLQRITSFPIGYDIPIQGLPIASLDDAEQMAEILRERWRLGGEPIANMVATLEDRGIHVVDIDASEEFDGIAAVCRDEENRILAATVVTRCSLPGERQRLNLAHELGHLVLRSTDSINEERAAFRFGAAFLAPAVAVRARVGLRRTVIQAEELLLLKQYFGLSIQALLYRMRTLGIIAESYYKQWCIDINRLGWKRHEPAELPAESPTWMRHTVLRAVSEGLLSAEEAQRMLGDTFDSHTPVLPRRTLMQLPIEERRRILAMQAAQMVDEYPDDADRDLWQGGDIVE